MGAKMFKYFDGVKREVCRFTTSCLGRVETVDGHNSFGHQVDPKWGCLIDSGCHECGYTGKRRVEEQGTGGMQVSEVRRLWLDRDCRFVVYADDHERVVAELKTEIAAIERGEA